MTLAECWVNNRIVETKLSTDKKWNTYSVRMMLKGFLVKRSARESTRSRFQVWCISISEALLMLMAIGLFNDFSRVLG